MRVESRNGRRMALYRCACGKEAWRRVDSNITRFRTCSCPTPRYRRKTKICRGCGRRLRVSRFYRDHRTGNPRPRCKECHPTGTAAPDVAKATQKRAHIRRRFGISPEDYERIVDAQSGLCAICRQPEPQARRQGRLSLDHCHDTGDIRGAICSRCNTMLGYAKDDPTTLREAAKYLEQHERSRTTKGDGSGT